ncbi:cupin domain-containing protein [Aeromicrobium sp. A1-2]|uniref:cupin domain-containing protein n=1 Tax=Aeromicrobium sp. A1-2 TaxID=2107713 RepID=UPI001C1FB6ED|nr:cupin domain-containing protein [Aeromicrobium sp. A1-2]
MTTYASPTQGGADVAVWRVAMDPGASGPPHAFDVAQVWNVVDGAARIQVDTAQHHVQVGDTIVVPAGVQRQVNADGERGFTAVVAALPGGRASRADGSEPVVPDWIA